MTPTAPTPQQPQTIADIKAEREYQRLLARRLAQQQLQKRLADDLARPERERLRMEQEYARSAPGRLAELRERQRLARDEAAVMRQVREMDLRQRYGRLGGMYAGFERFGQSRMGQMMGAGVTAFGATVGGMARSGFSGTVEQNRFDFEMKLVSREVAGAFKPLLDLGTKLATRVRKTMEGMDTGQQDAFMVAGLAAGAYGLHRFGGAAGRLLGFGGAGAGLAGAGGAAGGGLAGAGGAMAGGGLAARLGGLGRTAGRLGPWAMVASLGASMGGFGVQAEQDSPYNHSFASQHPEMAALLDGKTAAERRAMLAEAEANKPNAVLRGLGSAGKWGRNAGAWALNQVPVGDRIRYIDESSSGDQLRRELVRRGDIAADGRRKVTPDQFGYEEVGSAYKRASVSFLSQTSGERPLGPNGNPVATPGETAALWKEMVEKLEAIRAQGERKVDVTV